MLDKNLLEKYGIHRYYISLHSGWFLVFPCLDIQENKDNEKPIKLKINRIVLNCR